jgi:subfamily B ATP-binding cassette protein MsbA
VSFVSRIQAFINRRFDPRLSLELHGQWKTIRLGMLCTAVASALDTSSVYLVKKAGEAVDSLAQASRETGPIAHQLLESGMRLLIGVCVAVVIIAASKYWFTRGQTYYLTEAANRLAKNLRVRMMDRLLRLPIGYYNDRRAGAIQSILTNDVNVYQNAVGIIRDSIKAPVTALLSFAWIIYINWRLAAVAILLLPVMAAVIRRNSVLMRKAQGEVQSRLADVSSTMVEILSGTRVIKAFGAEDRVKEDYDHLVETTFERQMVATGISATLGPLQDVISAFAMAFFLFLCGLLASRALLTLGTILALAVAMDKVNQGFRSLGGVTNTFSTVEAASDRIYSEILDMPPSLEFGGGTSLPNPRGLFEFEHVSFRYPDGTLALEDVSFKIEPGHSLALVGSSGAGKSTIADLMLRFYDPTEGRILFDGVDVRDLDVHWLRDQIGVVPQQTFLFAGTIEDNVRVGAPSASDEEIREALRQAHAEEFTQEMAGRTTNELGERGVRLSGGQMQRVAIARALVRKPTVLLLDEATSALDANSEKAVTEALHEVMQHRTTLFIAHRLTTAARADKILVLSRGRAVEMGSHTELLAAKSTYANLFSAFSGGVLT